MAISFDFTVNDSAVSKAFDKMVAGAASVSEIIGTIGKGGFKDVREAADAFDREITNLTSNISSLQEELATMQAESVKAFASGEMKQYGDLLKEIELQKKAIAIDQDTLSQYESFKTLLEAVLAQELSAADQVGRIGQKNSEVFQEFQSAIADTSQQINTLSLQADAAATRAADLKAEIISSSAGIRVENTLNDQAPTMDQLRTLAELKQKVEDYRTAVVDNAAAASSAFEMQQQKVVALNAEMERLQMVKDAMAQAGDVEGLNAVNGQIELVTTQLKYAEDQLQSLASASQAAQQQLADLPNTMAQLEQSASGSNGFFGLVIDSATAVKDRVVETFGDIKEAVMNRLSGVIQGVKDAFNTAVDVAKDVGSRIYDGLGLDRLGDALLATGEKVGNFLTGGGRFQEGVADMKNALSLLPEPLQKVATGFMGGMKAAREMAKGMMKIVATPLGAVLTIIALALQAVYKWMQKDVEGQKAFAQLTAYLGSILESVTDIVVIFGRYLFNVFKQADSPLRNFIKAFTSTFKTAFTTVGNLFKGFGNIVKGVFTLNWDTFKNGVTQLGKGLTGIVDTAVGVVTTAVKGVGAVIATSYDMLTNDNLHKELGDAANGIFDRADKASALAARQFDMQQKITEANQKALEMDKEIADRREKVYALKGKAKEEEINKIMLLQKKRYDSILAVQKEELAIVKEKNALHVNDLAAYQKERELKSKILQTEAQQAASTRMMARMYQSTLNKMERDEQSVSKKSASEAKKAAKQSAADAKKNRQQQVQINEAAGALGETLYKNNQARVKAAEEMEREIADVRIATMKRSAERIRRERERALEKELEQIDEQRKKAIEEERNRQKEEFEKQQKLVKAQGGKVKQWDQKAFERSFAQSDELKKITAHYSELANSAVQRNEDELQRLRTQNLIDYLRKYGSMQEQMYAIEKAYNQKIFEEEDENRRKALEKEKQAALAQANARSMAQNINWGASFEGIGTVLGEVAKETLRRVEEYMKTSDFQSLEAADKKAYTDLRDKLMKEIAGSTTDFGFGAWGDVAEDAKAYQDAVLRLRDASEAHTNAVNELRMAERILENATSETAKSMAKSAVEIAQQKVEQTGEAQENAQQQANKAQTNLTNATGNAVKGMQNFNKTLRELSGGGLYGFANGLTKMITSIGGTSKSLAELGKVGGLVGAALQILDAMGDAPADFIEKLLNKVADAIGKILEQLPNVLKGIVTGVLNIIGSAISGVASLIGADLGGILSADMEPLEAATEKWGWLLDSWKDNIEYERKLMKDSYGGQTLQISARATDSLRDTQKAAREMYAAWASSGNSMFAHSYGYRADRSAEWQYLEQYSAELANVVGRSTRNLFNLSAEQLEELKYHNSQFWNSLHEETRKYLDIVIEAGQQLEELEQETRNQLTSTTFENVVSKFTSALADMNSSSKDFADNFQKYMQNAVINSMMAEKYKEKLDGWYKRFAAAMNGGLDATEQEWLQFEWDTIVKEATAEREEVRKALGWRKDGTSSSGTAGGFSAASQDSVEELNGRFTALQISASQISSNIMLGLDEVREMASLSSRTLSVMMDIQVMMAYNNQYLDSINGVTETMYRSFGIKLDKLIETVEGI